MLCVVSPSFRLDIYIYLAWSTSREIVSDESSRRHASAVTSRDGGRRHQKTRRPEDQKTRRGGEEGLVTLSRRLTLVGGQRAAASTPSLLAALSLRNRAAPFLCPLLRTFGGCHPDRCRIPSPNCDAATPPTPACARQTKRKRAEAHGNPTRARQAPREPGAPPNRAGRATRRGGCDGGGQGRWRRARCGGGSRAEPCSPEREAVGPSSDPRQRGATARDARGSRATEERARGERANRGVARVCRAREENAFTTTTPALSLACFRVCALHFVACPSYVVVCYVVSMCVV